MATSTTTLTTSIGSFNRGPITELFVAPTSCYQTLTSGTQDGYLYAGHFSNSYFDPDCYPPGTIGNSGLELSTAFSMYYYSPAICPSGWATATTISGQASGFLEVIPLGTATSVALCCPTGYAYDGFGHECSSQITPGQTITYVVPTEAGTSFNRGEALVSSVQSTITVSMDGVPIWWQASDEAALAAALQTTFYAGVTTATTTSSTTITSPPSSSSTISSSSTPSTTSSSGLSTGAKIAIGVMVPVAFFVLLGAALMVYFRKRRVVRRPTNNPNQVLNDYNLLAQKGEAPFESDGAPVYELHHQQPPAAADGGQDRSYELAG